jgi:hypothetical protein
MTIEDIILGNDGRGISALRPHLSPNYCADAAGFAMSHPGTTLIATGFWILSGEAVETDGPSGAVAIGRALESMGRRVVYVTDAQGAAVVRAAAGDNAEVVEFPHGDRPASDADAQALVDTYTPSLLIGIERCAPSADGLYRNMRGVDIGAHTSMVDALFHRGVPSIGIGDGGNEIGMGLLAPEIAAADKLPDAPAVTSVDKLVIASVSNWGAWGLLAAMSLLMGENYLPNLPEEMARVRACVGAGAVDGFSGDRTALVDGFDLDTYCQPLADLRALVGVRRR